MKEIKCWACKGKGYRTLYDDELIRVYTLGGENLSTKIITRKEWKDEMLAGKDITCSVDPFVDRTTCYHCKGEKSFIDLNDYFSLFDEPIEINERLVTTSSDYNDGMGGGTD